MEASSPISLEKTFYNPIFRGDYPDPTVLRDGDDYYITHSSGRYRPGLLLWHSKNLVDWQPICFICKNIKGDIWAPDLSRYGKKYYVYFTVLGSNFVVTADSIEGPWSDPVDLKTGLIDPCHCTDREGNRYLFFSDGNLVPLSKDGLHICGKGKRVYDGWRYPAEWCTEGLCLEAPKMVRRGDYYYLLSAEGGTAGPPTAHMVVAARSKDLFGPWENSPYNPIVHCQSKKEQWWNRGHATLLEDAEKKWWLVYHAYEKDYCTLGRRTLLEPVEWTDDGWFRVPQGMSPNQPLDRPAGVRLPPFPELSDDFTGNRIGFQWRFFDEFDEKRYQCTRNGIEIAGKGRIPSPMLRGAMEELIGASNPMTCMARDEAYEVSCAVTPRGSAEGGLLLFYNERAFCGIGLGCDGVTLYRRGRTCEKIHVCARRLFLKIVNDCHDVAFCYGTDGLRWNRLDVGMETSGYHHNTLGGYLSLRPALYSIGCGSAVFQTFRYRPIPRHIPEQTRITKGE